MNGLLSSDQLKSDHSMRGRRRNDQRSRDREKNDRSSTAHSMNGCRMVDSRKGDHRLGDPATVGGRHIPAAIGCRNHGLNNQTKPGVLQTSDHR
jgi:hypothetical protein